MLDLGPSDSFLLVIVLGEVVIFPLLFVTSAGVAVLRRRNDAPIGPVRAALLAFAGGACLGTLAILFNTLDVAALILGAAGAVAIARWRAGRRVQAGWLLLGTGLPPTLLSAVALLDARRSQTYVDSDAGLWFVAAAAAAALVGIAIVLRGDPSARTPSVAGPDHRVGG